MINQAEWLWQCIIERGSNAEGNFKESLNLQPGASDEEFQLIEGTLGVTLPEEMKNFYRVYNGQVWKPRVNPFVRNLTLSPTSEIIDNWKFLQEEFDPDDDLEPDIEKELKPVLWNSKWIPIAENGGGDYLCIDTDPSESGVVGQVLYYWHDWGQRSIKAKGLFEFIEICLKEEDCE
ncbi:SMI1/KNR4 family protein [Bacillus pseudomycoides]|uniref:SMI1/KNR4 family protein n=1 Tax=Bacillus pseudomycoides TaxID=64104 RepID=A0A2B6QQW5_9BACI|nr:SMI1/KNR4 family protein [Bacillus pseudomycoides]PDY43955.1 SMI1/KNR4 family protein [Bacillus pseudomycoides]PED05084.1 SMI1/KNR4 family protein [Bacillus pseudomycoides]PED68801.1 SMI1/KNR4 family protein [Bacillus pseudomycoides]PEI31837.1 SMI1/KNR4 family protein [Bacillus pseudomycoides]PEI84370.1 SMI1/KNR4 family protein [Bacillus pseudomycoides]